MLVLLHATVSEKQSLFLQKSVQKKLIALHITLPPLVIPPPPLAIPPPLGWKGHVAQKA